MSYAMPDHDDHAGIFINSDVALRSDLRLFFCAVRSCGFRRICAALQVFSPIGEAVHFQASRVDLPSKASSMANAFATASGLGTAALRQIASVPEIGVVYRNALGESVKIFWRSRFRANSPSFYWTIELGNSCPNYTGSHYESPNLRCPAAHWRTAGCVPCWVQGWPEDCSWLPNDNST